MKLRQIKPNPKNPRTIRDRNFYKLVDNLLRYPKFLEKRPIVYKDGIAQGGNMRYRGLEHILKLSEADFVKLAKKNSLSPELLTEWAGYRKSKDLPEGWFKDAADFTEEELAAFIVIDNVNAGDWDFDALANDWDEVQLADWGLEFPTLTPFPGAEDSQDDDDLLPVGEAPEKDSKPRATGDDFSVFEQVMLHTNKLQLLDVLNRIKVDHDYDKLEDALMHLAGLYRSPQS